MRTELKALNREAKRLERVKLKLSRGEEPENKVEIDETKPTIWSALKKHNAIHAETHSRTTEKLEALQYEEEADGEIKIV